MRNAHAIENSQSDTPRCVHTKGSQRGERNSKKVGSVYMSKHQSLECRLLDFRSRLRVPDMLLVLLGTAHMQRCKACYSGRARLPGKMEKQRYRKAKESIFKCVESVKAFSED